MRIITDKEKEALSIALQTFLRENDGKRRNSSTLLPVIERGLDAGLTLDEIFNPYNYNRAKAYQNEFSPTEYIDILSSCSIEVKSIKDEEHWADNTENFKLIAKCFHDFYIDICPKGGTWNTDNARINLEKAIRRNSLQTIMSEDLIHQVAILEYKKEKEDEAEIDENKALLDLTCFNYIICILEDIENLEIGELYTEEQKSRKEYYENLVNQELETPAEKEEEDSPSEEEDDGETAPKVRTETVSEEDLNHQHYNPFKAFDEDPENDINPENFIPEENESDEPGTGVFVSYNSPYEFKKESVQSVIMGFSIEELLEMSKLVNDVRTLSDFVNKLTDCQMNVDDENVKTRELHQFLNGELQQNFINCVKMQGFEMNEDMASQHDIINENWDFRDEKTRKLYKLKDIIMKFGESDIDLNNVIKDVEDIYSRKEENS